MLRMFAGVLLLTSLLLGACSSDENGNGGREGFIQDVEDQIEDLRSELEQLREDIADGDAGAEVEQQADALEGRINDAENELDEVRAASDDEWESLKGSVEDALGDAGDLADQIGSELGID